MEDYDENINHNQFYLYIKNECSNLFQQIAFNSWILCIPCAGSFKIEEFSTEDLLTHILTPCPDMPDFNYISLNHNAVTIHNKHVQIEFGNKKLKECKILFQETYYTDDNCKFKIWCLEHPLSCQSSISLCFPGTTLETINDAIELLNSLNIGVNICNMIKNESDLKISKLTISNIFSISKEIKDIYSNCMRKLVKFKEIKDVFLNCHQNKHFFGTAVQMCIQQNIYDTLIKYIGNFTYTKDSQLNKVTQNFIFIDYYNESFNETILGAQMTLSQFYEFKTTAEKLQCLKITFNSMETHLNARDKMHLLSVDDIIPLLSSLIIKSKIPNWYAQLEYMKKFDFSCSENKIDESGFMITTLEAVLEHLRENITSLSPYSEKIPANQMEESFDSGNYTGSLSVSSYQHFEPVCMDLEINKFHQAFNLIRNNDKFSLIKLLKNSRNSLQQMLRYSEDVNDTSKTLCHPLCLCMKCSNTNSKFVVDSIPTIYSRDSQGRTFLHAASIYGNYEIVESLLELGSEINAKDNNGCSALHHAAMRGHQRVLLCLLHAGANINCRTKENNTPLHLATDNGHTNCVKALVYFSQPSTSNISVNCKNKNGDTALHFAAKWAYSAIVKVLAMHGGDPYILNDLNMNTFDNSHNFKILEILYSTSPDLKEYEFVSSLEVMTLGTNVDDTKPIYYKNATKDIEKVFKIISYGDVRLACFYMNLKIPFQNGLEEQHILPCKGWNADFRNCSRLGVDACDKYGNTALIIAAMHGITELINILIYNEADTADVNFEGRTALHQAVVRGQTEAAVCLLHNKSDVNARDNFGNTALHIACAASNLEMVKNLLLYNPDIKLKNNEHLTCFDIATKTRCRVIIKTLETFLTGAE